MQLTQAILPVAGLGTRFLPWTKVVPKELLPIGNEPIIALLVDECLSVGIRDVCFVISKGKEAIPEYFTPHPELEKELKKRGKLHHLETLKRYDDVHFQVVYQEQQHGDGHAILQAKDWVRSNHVAILFGDDLLKGQKTCLQQLKEAAESVSDKERGAFLALENIPRERTNQYGIAVVERDHPGNTRLKKLKGLVEKPDPKDAPSTLGIIGRYIIPRSTFDVLPTAGASHGGEIRLIDALILQLKDTAIYGLECEGRRFDTGTPEGYAEAVTALSHDERSSKH